MIQLLTKQEVSIREVLQKVIALFLACCLCACSAQSVSTSTSEAASASPTSASQSVDVADPEQKADIFQTHADVLAPLFNAG